MTMYSYRVRFENKRPKRIEAEEVSVEGGALVLYREPDNVTITTGETLYRAFNEWKSVERLDVEKFDT